MPHHVLTLPLLKANILIPNEANVVAGASNLVIDVKRVCSQLVKILLSLRQLKAALVITSRALTKRNL